MTVVDNKDFLTTDPPIKGQKFVCMSFLRANQIDEKDRDPEISTGLVGLKIRGVFKTKSAAEAQCKQLRQQDPYHDIYVGEVGKWLPFDCREKVESEDYMEKQLNDIMQGYKESQEKAKQELKKRASTAQEEVNKESEKNFWEVLVKLFTT